MDVHLTSGSIDKPLKVALILVIIAMLIPSLDAMPLQERHRTRHSKKSPCGEITDSTINLDAKTSYDLRNVRTSLTYTVNNFMNELKVLNKYPIKKLLAMESQDWLPRINISELDVARLKRKSRFQLLLPKFYKQLLKFRIIFDQMRTMKIEFITNVDPKKRLDSIKVLKQDVRSLLCDVYEAMRAANIPIVRLTREEKSMEGFKNKVNETSCEIQDNTVYKAYIKLLKTWKTIFSCGVKSKCHIQYRKLFSRNRKYLS